MTKTVTRTKKQERVRFKVPRSVQEAIPIRRIWPDGVFQVGNQFSKSFSFTDINYAIASKDDKMAMFLDYSELLNALDSGAAAKITVNNRRVDRAEFERSVLLPLKGDALDEYREEFNAMLREKITANNHVLRERYLTISVVKKNITYSSFTVFEFNSIVRYSENYSLIDNITVNCFFVKMHN